MVQNKIEIHGARAHNLKNIDVTIPKNKLVVITGLSGSGKSSLAFDTLYAEGQRRYVESLSSYARQFLGQMEKPDVDSIEGLSPAISINQKTTSNNPRSTVGTVTEITDYLRLLWARIGVPICPNDGHKITSQSPQQIVDRILKLEDRTRIQILAPVVQNKKGQHKEIFKKIQRKGFVRMIVDGEQHEISDEIELDKNKKHSISIVVDRIIIKEGIRSRLFDSVEAALKLTNGYVSVDVIDGKTLQFSEKLACPYCGFSIKELEPRLFSFNAPFGACPDCDGLGEKIEVDPDLIIPDKNKSIQEGAIVPWRAESSKYYYSLLEQFCILNKIDITKPYKKLTKKQQEKLLYGDASKEFHFNLKSEFGKVRTVDMKFEGVIPNIERRYRDTSSAFNRNILRRFMTSQICKMCHGYRLNQQALAVKINGMHIGEVSDLPVDQLVDFFDNLTFTEQKKQIAEPIIKELHDRLTFLKNVGLDYLTLSRSARTLSGGEAQRIRLATQIGSNLSGIIYVLDEPSIGLHQRDNDRLIESLKKMRDLGNTLIVVEHDEDTMKAADYLIDIGPGAGANGGHIMAAGTPKQVMRNKNSLTGQYLSGKKIIPIPSERRLGNGKSIKLFGVSENNLKNINVEFPLGKFIAVTGVSGSGKSTLVNQVLERILAQKLNNNTTDRPGRYQKITGIKNLDKVINIDQSPIGRTPRSNPATYTGVFDDIRGLFAQTNQAKIRGYNKGRFSFNVKGGRCETCKGDGIIKIEMNFLPDIYVDCEVCHGSRFNSETLEIEYKGKNIAEVLKMTVDEALKFFDAIPKIRRKLQTISDVGLGYVQLGQSATTLSGGEAQRMKLASELHKKATGKTLYILDEPTTGLHADDINRLLKVLQRLVDKGNTVLVIEHNLDVIKNADHIIDLGPEGGENGGNVVVTGTPEEVALCKESYTGQYLKQLLNKQ
ncbi:excinuclease ABC subunit UvrA [Ligilactobacillus cholophilus]|uniref:excinuclease ABC subunit UvrA n=1 Tax=Ligilactobacillus cholophilus TaxID=3050131 RepID=UPI0025B1B3D6|nr:excinuclease ABC subunit UvrA [Ligilactobacillus cholophilus]